MPKKVDESPISETFVYEGTVDVRVATCPECGGSGHLTPGEMNLEDAIDTFRQEFLDDPEERLSFTPTHVMFREDEDGCLVFQLVKLEYPE